ncbi:SLAC1 anion channel family protein [Paraburkholderia acidiphila]|uniref:C4-dicarboxylate ABC transporter n=1 Tax=Paraburkholderia acidiphila TaxID=2571747 RepID=A0A7Z2JAE1_9BURK|nr:SLAC1 anion channel family protein [Paraburkholderia acidiphila]QGZ56633.1 C4-dicarboxylate ABC transporter [Paraburkholderia acidiphila]
MSETIETQASFGSPQASSQAGRLGYLPVALFGSVMGLAGLSSAWRLAHRLYGMPLWVAQAIGVLAVLAFLMIGTGYAVKWVTGPHAVKAEFNHPIAGNLFGTFFISLLLLPIPLADFSVAFARAVWIVGAIGMIVFAWFVIMRWLSQRQQPSHATPTWIVPVVGLIDIPLATPAIQITGVNGVLLLALAVGLFFAVPLFTLIFSRLMFEEPMPNNLQPTLLILLAPFAVGFSAYVTVTGDVDRFADALYMLTLFLLTVLVGRLRYLAITCPFRLSWWAVSFPLAGSVSCAERYADHAPGPVTHGIAIFLLATVTPLLLLLAARTLWGVLRGELEALAH